MRAGSADALSSRDARLFGDLPVAGIGTGDFGPNVTELSTRVHRYLTQGQVDRARDTLAAVVGARGIESRHLLQAWHAIRELGGPVPANCARVLLGVIVEVGMDQGYDVLAAYEDLTAYYYNFAGGGIVWQRPDPSMDALVEDVLTGGSALLRHLARWEGVRRPAPSVGQMRLNMLTPDGLYFGEGPFESLHKEPFAKPLVQAATRLMQALTSLPTSG